jgi:hypothetical protein
MDAHVCRRDNGGGGGREGGGPSVRVPLSLARLCARTCAPSAVCDKFSLISHHVRTHACAAISIIIPSIHLRTIDDVCVHRYVSYGCIYYYIYVVLEPKIEGTQEEFVWEYMMRTYLRSSYGTYIHVFIM